MALSEARKGEVALKLLKQELDDNKVKLTQETRREFCEKARKAGVSYREAMEVIECLTRENLDKAFRGSPATQHHAGPPACHH